MKTSITLSLDPTDTVRPVGDSLALAFNNGDLLMFRRPGDHFIAYDGRIQRVTREAALEQIRNLRDGLNEIEVRIINAADAADKKLAESTTEAPAPQAT